MVLLLISAFIPVFSSLAKVQLVNVYEEFGFLQCSLDLSLVEGESTNHHRIELDLTATESEPTVLDGVIKTQSCYGDSLMNLMVQKIEMSLYSIGHLVQGGIDRQLIQIGDFNYFLSLYVVGVGKSPDANQAILMWSKGFMRPAIDEVNKESGAIVPEEKAYELNGQCSFLSIRS